MTDRRMGRVLGAMGLLAVMGTVPGCWLFGDAPTDPPTIEMPPGRGAPPQTSILHEQTYQPGYNEGVVMVGPPRQTAPPQQPHVRDTTQTDPPTLPPPNVDKDERTSIMNEPGARMTPVDAGGTPGSEADTSVPYGRSNPTPPQLAPADDRIAQAPTGSTSTTGYREPDPWEDDFAPNVGSYFRLGGQWVHVGSGPEVGYGTLTNGVDEFMGEIGDDMDGWEIRGGFSFRSPTPERREDVDRWRGTLGNFYGDGDDDWYPPAHPFFPDGPTLSFDFFYGEADDDIHVMEPIGERGFAFTYPNLESPSGATGVNFGATGGTLRAEVDYRWFGFELGAAFDRPIAERTLLTFRPSLSYRRSDWDYHARATSTTFADSFMDVDQDVDEHRFGARLDLRATRDLGQGFYGFFGTGLGVSYGTADWDSRYFFNVPVNPNPADRMFAVDQSEDEDYVAFDAGGEFGFGYARGQWLFELTLGIDWTSAVPEIDNTSDPNDSPAHLDTTDQATTMIMFEAGYRF